jgi:hypothetical protein
MPPYASLLGDEDIAALLNFIRLGFGNQAGAVSTYDVLRYRSALRP